MNSLRTFGAAFILFFSLTLSLSCRQEAKSDTASQENGTEAGTAYKEAPMIDPVEFDKGRKKSKAVLLDVRMPQEYEQGHIEGSTNINFFDPNFKNQLLDLDKKKKYYIYCKNDARSERAAEFMLQNDFPEVYVLKGGFEAWKAAGLQ